MLIGLYHTKKELRDAVGQPLRFEPTNVLVNEYTPFGVLVVRGPAAGDGSRPWVAEVTLIDGKIQRVD